MPVNIQFFYLPQPLTAKKSPLNKERALVTTLLPCYENDLVVIVIIIVITDLTFVAWSISSTFNVVSR